MTRTYRICTGMALIALAMLLTGCNTTKGIGADIENAGEGLKDSADRHGAD